MQILNEHVDTPAERSVGSDGGSVTPAPTGEEDPGLVDDSRCVMFSSHAHHITHTHIQLLLGCKVYHKHSMAHTQSSLCVNRRITTATEH